jgi:23S rRNA pseudouridine1911/1915/1917 synthase
LSNRQYQIEEAFSGQTVAAALRGLRGLAGDGGPLSWSEVRKHIHGRRVLVNGVVCIDDSRRVKVGDRVELLEHSTRPLPKQADIQVIHEDSQIIVIEKPAGMECERHRLQRGWSAERKGRQPTVFEALRDRGEKVFPVHRIDRDTSGLMVYPKTLEAQEKLIAAFAAHDIERVYLAVAIGKVESQTVHNWIIRDRGDGLRGTVGEVVEDGEEAITHVKVLEELAGGRYSLIECRLETGKTHQIRIHLAEMGHPLCGEKLYLRPRVGAEAIEDPSHAPRQALHCYVLGFAHPEDGRQMRFTSDWPRDLERWRNSLA